MAGNLKLKAGTTTTAVNANGTQIVNAAVGIANGTGNLTNSTNLDKFVTAVLTGAAGAAPAQYATVSLYLVPKADGTNVGNVDTANPPLPSNFLVGFFIWPQGSSSSSQVMPIPGIPLEAYDYVPYLVNNLGQTLSTNWGLVFYGTIDQYT